MTLVLVEHPMYLLDGGTIIMKICISGQKVMTLEIIQTALKTKMWFNKRRMGNILMDDVVINNNKDKIALLVREFREYLAAAKDEAEREARKELPPNTLVLSPDIADLMTSGPKRQRYSIVESALNRLLQVM